MSLAGCQIILSDLNLHLQKCLEIFDKNSADKIESKKDKEIKVSPSCQLGFKPFGLGISCPVDLAGQVHGQNWKLCKLNTLEVMLIQKMFHLIFLCC